MAKTKTGSSSTAGTAGFAGTHPLKPEAIAWAATRGISKRTLELLRVSGGTAPIQELNQRRDVLMFRLPYGWKARTYPDKHFISMPGTKPTFWGIDEVLKAQPKVVYITEGEMDRCALVEAGLEPGEVLAAAGAAGAKREEALAYVDEALKAGLDHVESFVLCMDQDEPGLALRKMMARVLGLARCKFIDWPEPDKDANDYLIRHGDDVLASTLRTAPKWWPASGVYRLRDMPEQPKMELWSTGFDRWKNQLWLGSGTLSVVTGQPTHGKTHFWAQVWYQIAKRYDIQIGVATFETTARPHFENYLRQFHLGRKIRFGPANFTFDELKAADDWIHEHYLFFDHEDGRPTLGWLLENAEIAVRRHKLKVLDIDPWNRLEAHRAQGENETDYIGKCLRELYQFAKGLQVHVQVVAHPSKSDFSMYGRMPGLENIAGSKNWENMCDQGFVVWRPRLYDDNGVRQTYAELHHLKSRFDQLGHASKFGIEYQEDAGKFITCDLSDPKKKDKVKAPKSTRADPDPDEV